MAVKLSLEDGDLERIDRQLSTGRYSDAAEVVRAGLELLERLEDGEQAWLAEEVSARVADMTERPDVLLPAEDVFAGLEAHHKKRSGQTG